MSLLTVQEEDEYIVIFHNSLPLTYDAALSFQRFEYDPVGINGSFCSAPSGRQCTVDILYGTGSQLALVVTDIPENVDWGENVDVRISCNRWDWAYALVILIPLLVVGAIIAAIICVWIIR